MACFRRVQSNFHGIAVTHFTNENNLWRLAQSGAQAIGKSVKVFTQFPLIDGGFFLLVCIFHRVFQSNYVHRFLFINFIDNGGKRRSFTTASRSRYQNDAVFFNGNTVISIGQAELCAGWNLCFQFSQNDGVIAALRENIHAETGHTRQLIR